MTFINERLFAKKYGFKAMKLKRNFMFLLVMTLTLAAHAVSGTSSINGRLVLKYSFSGGALRSSEPVYNGQAKQWYYECDVAPGETLKFSCSCKGEKVRIQSGYWDGDKGIVKKEVKEKDSASLSLTVPSYYAGHDNLWIDVLMAVVIPTGSEKLNYENYVLVRCYIVSEPIAEDKERVDSKIRFNDLYGEVKIRPDCEEDDAYEFAEYDTIIYEFDRIKTEEDSGAVLGLRDMNTFVVKPESILVVHTEDVYIDKWAMLKGCVLGNIQKIMEGKTIDFEMSHCVCGVKGTIFALEDDGKTSRVYTLAGEVEVTAKKGGKKQSVKAGQTVSVAQDGKLEVKSFDIEKEAGRFGIPMEDITRHYEAGYVPVMSKGFEAINASLPASGGSSTVKSDTTSKAESKKKNSSEKSSSTDSSAKKKNTVSKADGGTAAGEDAAWKKIAVIVAGVLVAVAVGIIAIFTILLKFFKPENVAARNGFSQQNGKFTQGAPFNNTQNMSQGGYSMTGQPFGGQMQPPQNMTGYGMMQCPKCGKQLAPGTRFCSGCGTQLM